MQDSFLVIEGIDLDHLDHATAVLSLNSTSRSSRKSSLAKSTEQPTTLQPKIAKRVRFSEDLTTYITIPARKDVDTDKRDALKYAMIVIDEAIKLQRPDLSRPWKRSCRRIPRPLAISRFISKLVLMSCRRSIDTSKRALLLDSPAKGIFMPAKCARSALLDRMAGPETLHSPRRRRRDLMSECGASLLAQYPAKRYAEIAHACRLNRVRLRGTSRWTAMIDGELTLLKRRKRRHGGARLSKYLECRVRVLLAAVQGKQRRGAQPDDSASDRQPFVLSILGQNTGLAIVPGHGPDTHAVLPRLPKTYVDHIRAQRGLPLVSSPVHADIASNSPLCPLICQAEHGLQACA